MTTPQTDRSSGPASDMPDTDTFTTAKDLVFAPVGADGRVVEAVVRRLGEAIALGLLRPGERLPSENDLAGQLEVSTVTLREALNIMRRSGVVETKRGRGGGTIVHGYGPAAGRDELIGNLRGFTDEELRDLIAFGRAISGYAAAAACEFAATAEIKHLRELVTNFKNAGTQRERRRADALLHIQIAAISRSSRVTQAEMNLQADLNGLVLLLPDEESITARADAQHSEIVDAIAERNPNAARRAAESHLERLADLVSGLVLGQL